MIFLPKHKGIICDEIIIEEVKTIDRIILDEKLEDNGSNKTPDQWIKYWNRITDGRVMASMGDLYIAFKNLKDRYEKGSATDKSEVKQVLIGLRDDFDWLGKNNWLITSTRLVYNDNNLNARIIQHYKCSNPELVKDNNIGVPVYRGVSINQVVNDSKGLLYLQTLFNTNDDSETIMHTLEFISGKNRNVILIWTPSVSERKSFSNGTAGLTYHGNGLFRVESYIINSKGRSRGVKINKNLL